MVGIESIVAYGDSFDHALDLTGTRLKTILTLQWSHTRLTLDNGVEVFVLGLYALLLIRIHILCLVGTKSLGQFHFLISFQLHHFIDGCILAPGKCLHMQGTLTVRVAILEQLRATLPMSHVTGRHLVGLVVRIVFQG